LVQLNPVTGRNNYFPLVSFLVDEAGGRAFVTQFADSAQTTGTLVDNAFFFTEDSDEARSTLEGILGAHAYITRLYTRISGWEMLADPAFGPSQGGNISNVIDLSGRPEIQACDDEDFARRIPCGDTYCGAGAECATTEIGDGCVCAAGSVAREIVSPTPNGREIHCQPEDFDLLQSVEGSDAGPCANNPCGENGACVVVGGFPSCSCDAGFAAVRTFNGVPSCRVATATFAVTQLFSPTDTSGCGCRNSTPATVLPWMMLVAFGYLRRRRALGR
ncbi:MAG: calcium-binding EGF-like domain-containing protein, partial [Myxococcota bacterium]